MKPLPRSCNISESHVCASGKTCPSWSLRIKEVPANFQRRDAPITRPLISSREFQEKDSVEEERIALIHCPREVH